MKKTLFILFLFVFSGAIAQTRTNSVDFNKKTTAPSTKEGRVYYNSTDKIFYGHDGTNWVSLVGGGGGPEVNDLSANVTWANIPDANVPLSAVSQHVDQAFITGLGFATGAHTVNTDTQLTQAQVGAFATAEGFIKAFTETDPIFTASQANNITAQMITDLGNLSGTNTGDQNAAGVPVTAITNLTATDVQAALAEHQADIDGLAAGGSDGVISNAAINGNNIDFTGTGGGFNGSVDVSSTTAVAANTAKTGITAQQASDITANNAKTGITPQQATDITTNNAKVGITTAQANEITANTAKVGITGTQTTKLSNLPNDQTAINALKADLVGGVVPTSQIPAVALSNVQTAASEAAMLALTTVEGNIVVRTDEEKTYMHNGGSAGTMADFTELSAPAGAVTSVNGQTGVIVLGKTDIGLGNVDNTSDANKPISTAQATINTDIENRTALNDAKNDYPSADATKVGHISVTQAVDLDALETAVANGSDDQTASEVTYDNTISGLTSTNVKSAIDEIESTSIKSTDALIIQDPAAAGGIIRQKAYPTTGTNYTNALPTAGYGQTYWDDGTFNMTSFFGTNTNILRFDIRGLNVAKPLVFTTNDITYGNGGPSLLSDNQNDTQVNLATPIDLDGDGANETTLAEAIRALNNRPSGALPLVQESVHTAAPASYPGPVFITANPPITFFQDGDGTEASVAAQITDAINNGKSIRVDIAGTPTTINPVTISALNAWAVTRFGAGSMVDPTTYEITPADGSTTNISGWFDETTVDKRVIADVLLTRPSVVETTPGSLYTWNYDYGIAITASLSLTNNFTTNTSESVGLVPVDAGLNLGSVTYTIDVTAMVGMGATKPLVTRFDGELLDLDTPNAYLTEGTGFDSSFAGQKSGFSGTITEAPTGTWTVDAGATNAELHWYGRLDNAVTNRSFDVSFGSNTTDGIAIRPILRVKKVAQAKYLNGGTFFVTASDQDGAIRTEAELENP